MDKLHQQVARARRRLVMEQFFSIAARTLFVAAIVAAVAVIVPKIWALGLSSQEMQIWYGAWLGGGLVLGAIVGVVWTMLVRRTELDAAIEIDHRFGLKERVSSALALTADDIDTPAGQALLSDAVRKANRLDINDKFRVRATPWLVLPPALWAVALLAALLIPNALPKEVAAEEPEPVSAQVKRSVEELKKQIQERREQATAAGLEEADKLLAELEDRTERMTTAETAERRQAQIELNDLRKEIEERREQLGAGEELKKQLQDLDDMQEGPADDMAQAMKAGDFQQAQQELQKLQDMLARDAEEGGLTEEQREDLAAQMNQLADKVQEAIDQHEQQKQELDDQIAQAQAAGDEQRTQQLQQQRDQLAQRDSQMQRMQQMSDALSQCSECMREGDGQAASQQLSQLSEQMGEMASQASEMELLDGALDQIAQARDAMNCPSCQGAGCEQCQGGGMGQGEGQGQGQSQGLAQGQGQGQGDGVGDGMGEGQGQGNRPEDDSATGTYDSRVAQNAGAGRAVIVGDADGPNQRGQVNASIQEAYTAAESEDSDPLAGQIVPKADREFTQDYFDQVREGGLSGGSDSDLD